MNNQTITIELYDCTKEDGAAFAYADYHVYDGDTLKAEVTSSAIPVKELKDFIKEEQLNVSINPVGGDRIHPVCEYLKDNLSDVVEQYLIDKISK